MWGSQSLYVQDISTLKRKVILVDKPPLTPVAKSKEPTKRLTVTNIADLQQSTLAGHSVAADLVADTFEGHSWKASSSSE